MLALFAKNIVCLSYKQTGANCPGASTDTPGFLILLFHAVHAIIKL